MSIDSSTDPGTVLVHASAVLDGMSDPVVVVDGAARLLWANRAAEERFGWRFDDLAGTTVDGLVHPSDHATALASLESVQAKGTGTLVEIRVREQSGQYAWFEVRGRAMSLDGGETGVVLNLRESTARRQWEVAAGDPRVLGAVFDAAAAITLLLDASGQIRSVNRAFTRLLGVPVETAHGRALDSFAAADERTRVADELAKAAEAPGSHAFEARFATLGGRELPLSVTAVNLLSDQVVGGLVISAVDISSLVATRAHLRHLATHDQMTGLPNRAWLRRRLDQLINLPGIATHTILFGDVDGLKRINDTAGHRAGDVVLAEVAHRLRRVLRREDIVARLGGDEFVIVAATVAPQEIALLRQRIDGALEYPIELPDGRNVAVTMSLGVAAIEPTIDADDLLAAADAAMYLDKRSVRILAVQPR